MGAAPGPNLATDANAFAQMFKSHLASLTFNSKPIITNVTIIAQDYVQHMAVVVVQCLEEHILSVSVNLPPTLTRNKADLSLVKVPSTVPFACPVCSGLNL